MWNEIVRDICSVPVLLYLAIRDKKDLEVSHREMWIAIAALLLAGVFAGTGWESRLGGAAYGVVVVVFCLFSKEALGLADGVIILVCGIAFGLYETAGVSFIAMVATALVSAVLLICKKAGRKSRLPFFPFLLFGYVLLRLFAYSV